MEFAEAMRHAESLLHQNKDMMDRLRDGMPAYIFYWREDRKRARGWCTNCRFEVEIEDARYAPDIYENGEDDRWFGDPMRVFEDGEMDGRVRQGHAGLCPWCGHVVTYKAWTRYNQRPRDHARLEVWTHSPIDRDVAACVVYDVYSECGYEADLDRWDYDLDARPVTLCAFRDGEGGTRWGLTGNNTWTRRKRCEAKNHAGTFGSIVPQRVNIQSLSDVVADAGRAKELMQELYEYYTMEAITWMDRVMRYPCIEMMHKLGMEIAASAAMGIIKSGLINWRGKTAAKVLRITPTQWGEIKSRKIMVTEGLLLANRALRQMGLEGMGMSVAQWMDAHGAYEAERFMAAVPQEKRRRIIRYCMRKNVTLGDYADFVAEMRALGANTNDRRAMEPDDFHEIHARNTARLRAAGDKTLDKGVRKRAGKLAREYTYSFGGLTLKPFETAEEIIAEGELQSICIGRYVKRYAEGGTILCKLRQDKEPDKPYRAVEFATNGTQLQCRGYKNTITCKTPEEQKALDAFWEAFKHRNDLKTKEKTA